MRHPVVKGFLMRRFAAAVMLVLALAAQARAWSDAGHKIIASIALRQLTPEQRGRIVALLQQHPRYEQDFEQAMPANVKAGSLELQTEWLFQQSAIWADLARGFSDADKERFHRPTWHYINRPLFLTEQDRGRLQDHLAINLQVDPTEGTAESLNVIQAIRLGRKVAGDPRADPAERALMLSWLFHTIGDVHQPLHSTAMFAEGLFPEGDRGGNLVRTGQRSNLHSVWDGLPGGRMQVADVRNRALELMQADQSDVGLQNSRASLNETDWLAESHALCEDVVYTEEVLAHLRRLPRQAGSNVVPLSLSETYLQTAGAVAKQRLVTGGHRLGAVLQEVADAGE